MNFSDKTKMREKIFIFTLLISGFINAQKPQKIAYLDLEYIMENIPAYAQAQKKLDDRAAKWKRSLETSEKKIKQLKSSLDNERIILTVDLIQEKEEEIKFEEIKLKERQVQYFGPNGMLFDMRQRLVKPLQDEIFNAVQSIVKKKKYDFVFDRSGDWILLHANPKYDISKTVIAHITKTKKQLEIEETKLKKEKTKETLQKRIEAQKQRRAEQKTKIIHR